MTAPAPSAAADAAPVAHRPTLTPTVKPAEPELTEHYIDIVENQRNVDFKLLFGDYLRGATEILLVDPYIHKFHQMRNLMEFMEMLLELKSDDTNITVRLQTSEYPEKPEEQRANLEEIAESCLAEGIEFLWEFVDGDHDRYIQADTGWRISLGRGLDIYLLGSRSAFQFSTHLPSRRACKKFSVQYLRVAES